MRAVRNTLWERSKGRASHFLFIFLNNVKALLGAASFSAAGFRYTKETCI